MTVVHKTFYRVAFSAMFLIAVVTGCDFSISEGGPVNLNPNDTTSGGCDTINVSYATTVWPLVEGTCLACHSVGDDINKGVSLATYEEIKSIAQTGRLEGAITHAEGFTAMPMGLDMLDSCTIAKIRSWIREGALNN